MGKFSDLYSHLDNWVKLLKSDANKHAATMNNEKWGGKNEIIIPRSYKKQHCGDVGVSSFKKIYFVVALGLVHQLCVLERRKWILMTHEANKQIRTFVTFSPHTFLIKICLQFFNIKINVFFFTFLFSPGVAHERGCLRLTFLLTEQKYLITFNKFIILGWHKKGEVKLHVRQARLTVLRKGKFIRNN